MAGIRDDAEEYINSAYVKDIQVNLIYSYIKKNLLREKGPYEIYV